MSWRKVKLGELVETFSVRAKDVGGADGLEFFGVSNEVGITKTKYAAEEKAEDYKIIEQYCFAYNPYRVNVGSIGMVTDDIKGLISPAYVVFKPKPNSIKAELLLKFLKSSEGLRQIKFYARGTVRQALRFEDLCNIELSLPDFEEQEILFEKLNAVEDEANDLEIELTHQQDLLKQLRQSFLREAMQGKLVEQEKKDGNAKELLQKIKAEKEKLIAEKKLKKEKELAPIKEEEIPFDIPENWVWCRLGEIAEIGTGATPLTSNDSFYKGGTIPWITSSATNNLFVDEAEFLITEKALKETNCKVYPKGTLVVAMYGQGKTRGQITELNIDAATNQACATISFFLNDFYLKKFVKLFFQKIYDEIRELAQGGAQPNLNMGKIRSTIVPLPPLAEQKRIVKKLEEVMNLCDELKTTITDNQTYTDQLLQVALKDALQMKEVVEV